MTGIRFIVTFSSEEKNLLNSFNIFYFFGISSARVVATGWCNGGLIGSAASSYLLHTLSAPGGDKIKQNRIETKK